MTTKIVFRSAALVFLGVGILLWIQLRPQPALTLTALDVGQGDAILIHSRDGTDALIDGGPSDRVLTELGAALPVTDRTIELMFLTHPHADHLSGLLSVLKRYRVERVISTDVKSDSGLFQQWQRAIANSNFHATQSGDKFRVGLATLTVLWPPPGYANSDLNETSLVIRLDVGQHCALLMGDAGFLAESRLLKEHESVNCEVLKVGHHGSSRASSEAFLRAVRPQWAVISVGKKNGYGLPAPSALERLRSAGAQLWQTGEQGSFNWACDSGIHCRVRD